MIYGTICLLLSTALHVFESLYSKYKTAQNSFIESYDASYYCASHYRYYTCYYCTDLILFHNSGGIACTWSFYSSHQPVEAIENGWLEHHTLVYWGVTYQGMSMLRVVSLCRPHCLPRLHNTAPTEVPLWSTQRVYSSLQWINRVLVLP